MKFTKPITTKSGIILDEALIRLRHIDMNYIIPYAQITIDVFKDIASETTNDPIADSITGDRFHVTMEDSPEAQALLEVLQGKTVMKAVRAWLKSVLGTKGVIDLDATGEGIQPK